MVTSLISRPLTAVVNIDGVDSTWLTYSYSNNSLYQSIETQTSNLQAKTYSIILKFWEPCYG